MSLKNYYGTINNALPTIELEDQLQSNLQLYLKLKDEKKEVDRKSRVINEQLKQLSIPILDKMGTAGNAVCGTKFEITRIISQKPSISKESLLRLKADHPSIYNQYAQDKDQGKFIIKERFS